MIKYTTVLFIFFKKTQLFTYKETSLKRVGLSKEDVQNSIHISTKNNNLAFLYRIQAKETIKNDCG